MLKTNKYLKNIKNMFNIFNTVPSVPHNITEVVSDEMNFRSNGILTLGVEVEFQLIDLETGNLSHCANVILDKAKSLGKNKIKPEFYLSTLEINTDKCNNVHDVKNDLTQSFCELQQIAKEMNVGLSTTG